jgi:hypothetical protein
MFDRSKLIKKVAQKLAKNQNSITWIKPKFAKELDGFFAKGDTQAEFKKNGLEFNSTQDVLSFLGMGSLKRVPDDVLAKKGRNLTVSKEEFEKKLQDQVFATSFKKLEKGLEKEDLRLEAPILIKFSNGIYWGFSGNRRANLARKYGLPVDYYVVDQNAYNDKYKKTRKPEDPIEEPAVVQF